MKKILNVAIIAVLAIVIVSCSKVPITGRKQFKLLPNSQVMELSLTSYKEFLQANPPMAATTKLSTDVGTVGKKIGSAVEQFMKQHGYSERVAGYKWEFNAVDSKDVNAWCMPGGKVVVYSGLMPVARDNAGLAVVMGHEIAHAIAEHGNERMSEALMVQLGGIGLELALQTKPQQTRDLFLMAYGVGTTLGTLAYSRNHELEADRLGLIFMAMAGYDPQRALSFWQDMSKVGGAKPPAFLSTHPSDQQRIQRIIKYLPEAKKYYKP